MKYIKIVDKNSEAVASFMGSKIYLSKTQTGNKPFYRKKKDLIIESTGDGVISLNKGLGNKEGILFITETWSGTLEKLYYRLPEGDIEINGTQYYWYEPDKTGNDAICLLQDIDVTNYEDGDIIDEDLPWYCIDRDNESILYGYDDDPEELSYYTLKIKKKVKNYAGPVEQEVSFSSGVNYLKPKDPVETIKADYEVSDNATSIKKVILPYDMTETDDYMFFGCTSLEEVVLPEGLEKIGNYCFCGGMSSTNNITNINFPKTIQVINSNAFKGTKIVSVTIPDSITLLGNGAFSNCPELTSLTFSKNIGISRLNNTLLMNSSNCKDIYFDGLISEYLDFKPTKTTYFPNDIVVHCSDGNCNISGSVISE